MANARFKKRLSQGRILKFFKRHFIAGDRSELVDDKPGNFQIRIEILLHVGNREHKQLQSFKGAAGKLPGDY